jgi:hypothetical protein
MSQSNKKRRKSETDASPIEIDQEDGQQKGPKGFVGTPEEVVDYLSCSIKGEWRKYFTPQLGTKGKNKDRAVLFCNSCHQEFGVSNPSRTNDEHKCKGGPLGGASSSKGVVTPYFLSANQKDQLLDNLCMFIFTNNIALHLIEDEYLRKAMAVVGLKLPCRKVHFCSRSCTFLRCALLAPNNQIFFGPKIFFGLRRPCPLCCWTSTTTAPRTW